MQNSEPGISVITPTYNRPRYLRTAIESVVEQDREDWELLVVNDGGEDVGHIIDAFSDERIRYFPRERNRGKAACLNFALGKARGEYIAYLDDDDVWYPGHLASLVGALERNPACGAAYSDPYEVLYVKGRGGRRFPLQKRARFCRHFSRSYMFVYNHVLPVSLVHRKELAFRAGGYNEDVGVLIDWNMNRKLCFFTDFLHVPRATGEHYVTSHDSDRISDLQRRDMDQFQWNVRRIRADLPPEPWPRVARVAVLLPVEQWSERSAEALRYFADRLAHPHRMVVIRGPDGPRGEPPEGDVRNLLSLPHVRQVNLQQVDTEYDLFSRAARQVDAHYYYLASTRVCRNARHRIMRALAHLGRERNTRAVRWTEDDRGGLPGDVFVPRGALRRELFPYPPAHPGVHPVGPHELPEDLQVDRWLVATERCLEEGDLRRARQFLELGRGTPHGGIGDPHVAHLEARIAFQTEQYDRACELGEELLERGYVPDNAVRLGRIYQQKGRYREAVEHYRAGLRAIGLAPSDLNDPVFPVLCDSDCDAYRAFLGLGECLGELGRRSEASVFFRSASGLRVNAAEAYVAFGELLLKEDMLRQAAECFREAAENARNALKGRALRGLARVEEARGDMEGAMQYAVRAVEAHPPGRGSVELAERLGNRLGQYEDLARLHEEHLRYCPADVQSLRSLADLYERLGNTERADSCTRKARALEPDDVGSGTRQAVRGG